MIKFTLAAIAGYVSYRFVKSLLNGEYSSSDKEDSKIEVEFK